MGTVPVGPYKITLREHELVWMPTKYAYFLADVLGQHFSNNMLGLELGLGSGILSIFAGLSGMQMVGLEINTESIRLCRHNWELNELPPAKGDFRHSDLFSAVGEDEFETFDLTWTNPPTFPGVTEDRFHRKNRLEYELAGEKGREVLDAMIVNSAKLLKPNGKMFAIASSRQGWQEIQELLNTHWKKWNIVAESKQELAAHYLPFVEQWRKWDQQDGDQRVFLDDGKWYETLRVVEGCKTC